MYDDRSSSLTGIVTCKTKQNSYVNLVHTQNTWVVIVCAEVLSM